MIDSFIMPGFINGEENNKFFVIITGMLFVYGWFQRLKVIEDALGVGDSKGLISW